LKSSLRLTLRDVVRNASQGSLLYVARRALDQKRQAILNVRSTFPQCVTARMIVWLQIKKLC